MNIIEKIIMKNRTFRIRIDREVKKIRRLFDSYEHEEDILDFLDDMECEIKNKYYYKVNIFDRIIDKVKISYINHYLETYIEMDKNKYSYKIRNIEYYIFRK